MPLAMPWHQLKEEVRIGTLRRHRLAAQLPRTRSQIETQMVKLQVFCGHPGRLDLHGSEATALENEEEFYFL